MTIACYVSHRNYCEKKKNGKRVKIKELKEKNLPENQSVDMTGFEIDPKIGKPPKEDGPVHE